MSALKKAKEAGFKNLAELSDISGVPIRTLQDQFKNSPSRFELAVHASIYRRDWKWLEDKPR